VEKSIVVVAEHADAQIKPVTYELLAVARKLQHRKTPAIRVVILGAQITDLARELAKNAGLDVTAVQIPEMAVYNAELYTRALTEVLGNLHPAYVCIANTSQGMDYAPALAVRLGAACITGVEEILKGNGPICFSRPLYGGKVIARVRPMTGKTVLTIQPGSFKAGPKSRKPAGGVTVVSMPLRPQQTRSQGVTQSVTDMAAIAEADVIVAAGQGIGAKENLELVRQLAAVFSKSAVAGSRIVCDRGWLEYRCQVGVTGATVSPRLYIACGISGAVQHVTGMRGSEFIVAINKDPTAAIFRVADVCVVEDLISFIPKFIEFCRKAKDSSK